MDIEALMALGFTVTGGMIDRAGVNYGVLTKEGPLLTPEGEAVARELAAAAAPKRGRPRKTEAETEDAPEVAP